MRMAVDNLINLLLIKSKNAFHVFHSERKSALQKEIKYEIRMAKK